ncbi:MAG: hypothetical protein QM626_10435 [Microbacterium sp.]|uniref:hypothetical protein n=1 Tax=Microbacterium sp. TaxID=51671 RepID=UPI0039E376B8
MDTGRRGWVAQVRSRAGGFADDRGDVPGWVLITLMTAGLVVVIWALAGPALASLFEQAIARVSGF